MRRTTVSRHGEQSSSGKEGWKGEKWEIRQRRHAAMLMREVSVVDYTWRVDELWTRPAVAEKQPQLATFY